MKTTGNDLSGTIKFLSLVVILFALLQLASSANEALKQWVISPGSFAEFADQADCREDELLEEGLSLRECQLMVANVQIALASSPNWFRPFQLITSMLIVLACASTIVCAEKAYSGRELPLKKMGLFLGILLLLDLASLMAAANLGPLLRASYLWPLLMIVFVHVSLLLGTRQLLITLQLSTGK